MTRCSYHPQGMCQSKNLTDCISMGKDSPCLQGANDGRLTLIEAVAGTVEVAGSEDY